MSEELESASRRCEQKIKICFFSKTHMGAKTPEIIQAKRR